MISEHLIQELADSLRLLAKRAEEIHGEVLHLVDVMSTVEAQAGDVLDALRGDDGHPVIPENWQARERGLGNVKGVVDAPF